MSQNVEEQIAEIKESIESQGKILRRVDRRMRYATYGAIIKWLVYLGLALGVFVWLKPYLEAISEVAAKIEDTSGVVSGFKESWREAYADFVDSFRGGSGTSTE